MDWTIKVTTENAVWGNIKTWGPPVLTLLLGFFIGSLKDWRRQREEVRNVRSMIREEIVWIRDAAQGLSTDNTVNLGLFAQHLTQTPVYDAYLGHLSILKEGESTIIQDLHHWLGAVDKHFAKLKDYVYEHPGTLPEESAVATRYLVDEVLKNTATALRQMEYHSYPWYRRIFRKEVSHVRADMKAAGEIKPIQVDEDKLDDI